MSFLLSVGRWLVVTLAFLALSIWISVMSLQMTLLNRGMVIGWLQSSGAYQHALQALPIEFQVEGGEQFITATDIKVALAATFPSSYIQQETEKVLNATYDWVEGKTQKIEFSIAINEKRADFVANMAKQLEPKLAALPQCSSKITPSNSTPTCLPKGVSASDYATQLTNMDADESNNFLAKPITADDVAAQLSDNAPQFGWLPNAVAAMRIATFALPMLFILLATGFVLMNEDKLAGVKRIGRHVFFNGLVFAVLGGALWYVAQTFSPSAYLTFEDPSQKALLESMLDPLLKAVLQGVGVVFIILGGGISIIGAAVWLCDALVRDRLKKQEQQTIPQPAETQKPEQPQVPPGNPQRQA